MRKHALPMAHERKRTEWVYNIAWGSHYRPDLDAMIRTLRQLAEGWELADTGGRKFPVDIFKGQTGFEDLDDAKSTLGPSAVGLTFRAGSGDQVIGLQFHVASLQIAARGDDGVATAADRLREIALRNGGAQLEPETSARRLTRLQMMLLVLVTALVGLCTAAAVSNRNPYWAAVPPVGLAVVGLVVPMLPDRGGGAWLVAKDEVPSFWRRNRDAIVVGIGMAIVASALSIIASYFLFATGIHS